jgi:hypothetical protein
MMIITHEGRDFDTDKIERVKQLNYAGSAPWSGRHVRIYFDDCLAEHSDPDGILYETFRKNGVYAS